MARTPERPCMHALKDIRNVRYSPASTVKRVRDDQEVELSLGDDHVSDTKNGQPVKAMQKKVRAASFVSTFRASPIGAALLAEYLWSPVATGRMKIAFTDPRSCFREYEWLRFNRKAKERIEAANAISRVPVREAMLCRLFRASREVHVAILVGIKDRRRAELPDVEMRLISIMCGNMQKQYKVAWAQARRLQKSKTSDDENRAAVEALAAAEKLGKERREKRIKIEALKAANGDEEDVVPIQAATNETAVIWVESRGGTHHLHIAR